MSDDPKKLGEIEVRASAGGFEGAIKVDANEAMVKFVRPELYRSQQAFDTILRGIHLKQDKGEELNPIEQQILMVSALPILSGKLENVAAVIKYAQECDADFGKYVNGKVPMSEPPRQLPPHDADELDIEVTVEGQEQQYWWDRFWQDAEAVTADYMRHLLGRIAAKKARDPKSISLRTVDAFRCLEAHVLDVFTRLIPFVISGHLIPEYNPFHEEYEKGGLTYVDLMTLEEAGLLSTSNVWNYYSLMDDGAIHFRAVGGLRKEFSGPIRQATLTALPLSHAGTDLFKLLPPSPVNETFQAAIVSYVLKSAKKVPLEWRPSGDEEWRRGVPSPPPGTEPTHR